MQIFIEFFKRFNIGIRNKELPCLLYTSYVDLNESSRGGRTYPILVDKLPPGLEIVEIEPRSLRVILE